MINRFVARISSRRMIRIRELSIDEMLSRIISTNWLCHQLKQMINRLNIISLRRIKECKLKK